MVQRDPNILQQVAQIAAQCGLEYEEALLILQGFQVKRWDGINHKKLRRYLAYHTRLTPRQKFARALLALPAKKRFDLIRGAVE